MTPSQVSFCGVVVAIVNGSSIRSGSGILYGARVHSRELGRRGFSNTASGPKRGPNSRAFVNLK